jgi:vacuolar-type H+-ATPase subunit F/Vma7
MSHTIRVVCRPALRDGFALAGVPCLPAGNAGEAAVLLAGIAEQSEVGVVLVEESLYDGISEELRRGFERHALPLVIPFPGPPEAEAPGAEARLLELLRRAIGYRVRLR